MPRARAALTGRHSEAMRKRRGEAQEQGAISKASEREGGARVSEREGAHARTRARAQRAQACVANPLGGAALTLIMTVSYASGSLSALRTQFHVAHVELSGEGW